MTIVRNGMVILKLMRKRKYGLGNDTVIEILDTNMANTLCIVEHSIVAFKLS